jgi:hypothetical protein
VRAVTSIGPQRRDVTLARGAVRFRLHCAPLETGHFNSTKAFLSRYERMLDELLAA